MLVVMVSYCALSGSTMFGNFSLAAAAAVKGLVRHLLRPWHIGHVMRPVPLQLLHCVMNKSSYMLFTWLSRIDPEAICTPQARKKVLQHG